MAYSPRRPKLLEVRMPFNETPVEIRSRDYWFKIVGFLQQNWALIDETADGCTVFFFGDTSGVLDRLSFPSVTKAEKALRRNGFAWFAEDKNAQEFIAVPQPLFHESFHPNGPIYSSGRFWRRWGSGTPPLTLRSRGTLRKWSSPARIALLTSNVLPFFPMG